MARLESRRAEMHPVSGYGIPQDELVDGEILTAIGERGAEDWWFVPDTARPLRRALTGYILLASVKVQELFETSVEKSHS